MLKKILVASLVGLTAAAANADLYFKDKAYVGLGVGGTSFSSVCDTVPSGSTVSSSSCDDTDTGWRLGVGYELTPNVAAELNYMGLGKGTTSVSYSSAAGNASGNGEFKADNVWAVQIGAHTKVNFIDRTTVYGKLGAAFSKYSSNYTTSNNTNNWSTSGNKVAPIVTIGMAYAFTPKWSAGLQLDYINGVGEVGPSAEKVNATFYSLGLNYMF